MTDLAALLTALADAGAEFVIVGGVAATIHGSSRLTQDVDLVYSRADENIARLVAALQPYRPYLRGVPPGLPFDWSAATLQRGLNFTLTTSLGDVDLLGEITGGGRYEDVLAHSVAVELFGRRHRCLDLEWLIRTKRAAGRPRDLEAIAELERLHDDPDLRGG